MRPSSFKFTINLTLWPWLHIYSGIAKLHLSHLPNIIHDSDILPPNTAHRISIRRVNPSGLDDELPPPTVKFPDPVGILPALGVLLAVTLLGVAITGNDETAVVALVLLSIILLDWHGLFAEIAITKTTSFGKGDSNVGRLCQEHQGYILVYCDEAVAQELYFTPKICHCRFGYKTFQICSGLAIFTYMIGVVFLESCTWLLQGLAYIILNGSYWFVGIHPPKLAWNLGMFDVY